MCWSWDIILYIILYTNQNHTIVGQNPSYCKNILGFDDFFECNLISTLIKLSWHFLSQICLTNFLPPSNISAVPMNVTSVVFIINNNVYLKGATVNILKNYPKFLFNYQNNMRLAKGISEIFSAHILFIFAAPYLTWFIYFYSTSSIKHSI